MLIGKYVELRLSSILFLSLYIHICTFHRFCYDSLGLLVLPSVDFLGHVYS
uniref:Uncharacterized protein n=1 Tax=Rhizophora mucronata TaxID=61149 RepID=A0A2P2PUD0_RHIMU